NHYHHHHYSSLDLCRSRPAQQLLLFSVPLPASFLASLSASFILGISLHVVRSQTRSAVVLSAVVVHPHRSPSSAASSLASSGDVDSLRISNLGWTHLTWVVTASAKIHEVVRVPAIGEAKAIDVTGVGDLFASGFCMKWSLEECCKIDACSGGSVTRSLGGESLFGKGIIPGPPLTTPSSSPMSIFHYIHFDCCFCFFNCRFVFIVSFRMRSRGTAWSSLLGLPLPPLPLLGLVSSFLRYSLRHFHDEKVEQRLESIEKA
ncbi:hypothetical protein S245_067426, partial [Arachis hypogaea]